MAKLPTAKESKISTIVSDKFPHFDFSRRNSYFTPAQLPEHLKNATEAVFKEEYQKVEKFRHEISEYSEEKINKLYEPVLARITKRRNEEIEKAENLLFHADHMKANYEFWGKTDHFTPEEFIALSFGKDPKYITKNYVKANECGGMCLSEFAMLKFPIKYLERFELLERSLAANPKNTGGAIIMKPQDAIKWAQNKGIKLPDELLSFYEKPVQQIQDFSLTKLPEKLHPNIIKVISYLNDQLEQSYGMK